MAQNKSNAPAWFKVSQPFIVGGLAGMSATCVIQPLDMIKVRIQLLGEGQKGRGTSGFVVARNIVKNEGVLNLYKGLSAALLRQATYTTSRMGIFRSLSNYMQKDKEPLPFYKKAFAGLAAGALGSLIGTPADVALIRMQADNLLPLEQRRNYKGVVDALVRMVREDGVLGLWKGASPTVARAMALNVGMLATYDQTKQQLQASLGDGFATQLGASAVAGFFASFFSLPFDFVKTRIQKQKPAADGTLPYKNSIQCAAKVFRNEGPMAFYRGFGTYYVRIAPHAMITLLAVEQFNHLIKLAGW